MSNTLQQDVAPLFGIAERDRHRARLDAHALDRRRTRGTAPRPRPTSLVRRGVKRPALPPMIGSGREAELGRIAAGLDDDELLERVAERAFVRRARPMRRSRACVAAARAGRVGCVVGLDLDLEAAEPPAVARAGCRVRAPRRSSPRPARRAPTSPASSSTVHGPSEKKRRSWARARSTSVIGIRPNDVRETRSTAVWVSPARAMRRRAASRSWATGESYARSDLNRVTVPPFAQHEIVALQRGVVPDPEADQRALVARARGQLLDAAQPVGDAGPGQVLGGGDALAEQAADVVRRAADRVRRPRAGNVSPSRARSVVVVGDRVDVLPARVAVAPVGHARSRTSTPSSRAPERPSRAPRARARPRATTRRGRGRRGRRARPRAGGRGCRSRPRRARRCSRCR